MLLKAASLKLNLSEITLDEGCCIWCDKFDEAKEIIRLPCDDKHIFHAHCIGEWMERNTTCPLCKVDVSKSFDKDGNLLQAQQNFNGLRYRNRDDIEMGDTEIAEDDPEQINLLSS